MPLLHQRDYRDCQIVCHRRIGRSMVKTNDSRFPPSPNLDKVTVSFDRLNHMFKFLVLLFITLLIKSIVLLSLLQQICAKMQL